MESITKFEPFLGDINNLVDRSFGDKVKGKESQSLYVHPKLKNLGCVNIVLIREVIAPFIARNFEEEITDIDIDDSGEAHVRAVPNKFKYPERGRGLQILRAFQAGGTMPQNKTALPKEKKPSAVYDLNTLVFGDSTVHDGRILSVKAAVNYSDALSVLPKHFCVKETAHVSTMEDGSLFDAVEKKSSSNIFNRHFIVPTTLLVQVLSTRGCLLPRIGLDHLLLSIGVAGTYGGQTSVTGTNIRTHIVGIYADKFEKPDTSPYELIKLLPKEETDLTQNVDKLTQHLHQHLSQPNIHQVSMDHKEACAYQQHLTNRFENDTLKAEYLTAKKQLDEFFDSWFVKEKQSS